VRPTTRVNWKLAAAVCGALLIVGLGAVGVWRWRRSPGRWGRIGDRRFEEGDLESAAAAYGRALRLGDDRARTYLKLARVLAALPPLEVTTAVRRTQQMVSALEHALEKQPSDDEIQELLITYYWNAAEAIDSPDAWRIFFDRARAIEHRVSQTSATPAPFVRLARLTAESRLLRFGTLVATPERVRNVREELGNLIRGGRCDVRALMELAQWCVVDRVQKKTTADACIRDIEALFQRCAARSKAPHEVRAAWARFLAALGDSEHAAKACSILTELEKVGVGKQTDSRALRRQAAAWVSLPTTSVQEHQTHFEHAENALRTAVRIDPANVPAWFELAGILAALGKTDEALAMWRRLASQSVKTPVGPMAVAARFLAPAAAWRAADLLLRRAAAPQLTGSARKRLVEEVRALIEHVAAEARLKTQAEILRARLFLAAGRPGAALDVVSSLDSQEPEVQRLAIDVLRRLGEFGEACSRAEKLLAPGGDFSRVPLPDRIRLARLYLDAGAPDKVRAVVRTLETKQGLPLGAAFLDLEAAVDQAILHDLEIGAANTGEARRAASLLQQFDALRAEGPAPAEVWRRMILLADFFAESARRDALLAAAALKFPKDPVFVRLQALFALRSGRRQAAAEAVRFAAPRFSNASTWKLAVSALDAGADVGEVLDLLVPPGIDARAADLAQARFLRRRGRIREAVQALKRASVVFHPGDEPLLAECVLEALLLRQTQVAEELLERASESGLDPVTVLCLRARVALHRQEFETARSLAGKAAQQRPLSSLVKTTEGVVAMAAGDPRAASAAWEAALRLRPNAAEARKLLAGFYARRGEYARCIELLRVGAMFAPDDPDWVVRLANALSRSGRFREAEALLRRVLARAPVDSANRRALAGLLAANGRPDEAVLILGEGLRFDSSAENLLAYARMLRAAGRAAEARTMLESKTTSADSEERRNAALALARYLSDAGLSADAVRAYRKAAEYATDPGRVLYELADRLLRGGRPDEAVPVLEDVWKRTRQPEVTLRYIAALAAAGKPTDAETRLADFMRRYGRTADALVLAAQLRWTQKDAQGALRILDEAVRKAPARALPRFLRAKIRMEAPGNDSDLGRVLNDLQAAVELDPGFIPAQELLVRWHLTRNPPDVRSAERCLMTIVRLHPGYLPARLELATLYLRTGETDRLEQFLNECRRFMPDLPVWSRLAAASAVVRREPEKTIQRLRTVYEKEKSPDALFLYAGALIEAGGAREALGLLDQRADLERESGGSPVVLSLRGWASAALGETERAEKLFVRALKSASASRDAPAVVRTIARVVRRALPPQKAASVLTAGTSGDRTSELAAAPILADVLAEAGQSAAAGDVLKKAAEQTTNPSDRSALLRRLLRLQVRRKLWTAAVATCRTLLESAPDDAAVLNNLAWILAVHLRRLDEALSCAERAVAQSSPFTRGHAEALDTLAWVHYLQGRRNKARVLLEQSIQEMPGIWNRIHLACVIFNEAPAEARRLLRAALDEARKAGDDQAVRECQRRLAELGARK